MAIPPINDGEEFRQSFDVLLRISENARKVIYAFVLIYGALLLWSLNAVLYPGEEHRREQILERDAQTAECIIELESKGASTINDDCKNKLKYLSLDYNIRKDHNNREGDTALGDLAERAHLNLAQIDSNYLQHEIQGQADRSAEIARFNVPLLGIASDRTWLWLVNLVLGPLFYFLIRDSLINVRHLLDILYKSSVDRPVRLTLLSVTQVISASIQRADLSGQQAGTSRGTWRPKFIAICLMFALPIFVSGLLLWDWYSLGWSCTTFISKHLCFLHLTPNSEFLWEPEFVGGILTIPITVWEIVLVTQIYRVLSKLFDLHDRIRTHQ